MPHSEGSEAWEEATDFGTHAIEKEKESLNRSETVAADKY